MNLSDKAKAMVLSFESVDQPGIWPEGDSGITIGYGYDLGYESLSEFNRDWAPYLRPGWLGRLAECCGKKGNDAAKVAPALHDIYIQTPWAKAVFEQRSVPKYMAQLAAAMPGVETLPSDAIGGLFSLIYNRGTKMDGDSRIEMRSIRDAVATYAKPGEQPRDALLRAIAHDLRTMKRLWVGKGLDGLLKRREAEAALVESCIAS